MFCFIPSANTNTLMLVKYAIYFPSLDQMALDPFTSMCLILKNPTIEDAFDTLLPCMVTPAVI